MKIARVCENCWYDNLSYDGSVSWDMRKQEYVIDDIRESVYCGPCGNEVDETEFEVDDKNNIKYPSVEEVCTEAKYESTHILAMAGVVADREGDEHEDIDRLYKAIVASGDDSYMVSFLRRFKHLPTTPVEDALMASQSGVSLREYLRFVHWGDKGRILDALLAYAVSPHGGSGHLSNLLDSNQSYNLTEEQMLRVRTIFVLLGGKIAVKK